MWSLWNFICDCWPHLGFPFYIVLLSIKVLAVNLRSSSLAFKFRVISVMHLTIDMSHFDIFKAENFPEGEQKRKFYNCDELEIKKSHFTFLLHILPCTGLKLKLEKAIESWNLNLSLPIIWSSSHSAVRFVLNWKIGWMVSEGQRGYNIFVLNFNFGVL